MNTDTRDLISIDPTHWGLVVSALVANHYGEQHLENLQIVPWNECESQWHIEGECDCPPDDDHRRDFLEHITAKGYRLVTWEEMED
jgi:hypothetical protein